MIPNLGLTKIQNVPKGSFVKVNKNNPKGRMPNII